MQYKLNANNSAQKVISYIRLITGSIAQRARIYKLLSSQRPILRFFTPQGRHVAPMGVKFGTEKGTDAPFSVLNFTPIGATVRV